MTFRKQLKNELAQQAENYAIQSAMCKVHGSGTKDCRCSLTLDSYQTTLKLFNNTISKSLDKRRRTIATQLKIKSYPHFVSPELAEFVSEHLNELVEMGHQKPEIIWDDGCCAAAYCDDCKTWGWFTYNYETDGVRWSTEEEAEYGGKIFDDKCEATQYSG